MQNFPHTWDGRQITATATSWSDFTTAESGETNPPVAITVQSVLAQIHAIRQALAQPKLDKALRDLYKHIQDTNNPHRTGLEQFKDQIIDVLYSEYIKAGGTGSIDFYLQSLFYTLRVATLDEMENSSNENLLVSILGAHRIIQAHEDDAEAHKELFEQWFPGEPISADPILVLMGSFGVLPNYLYKTNDDSVLDDVHQIAIMTDDVGDYTRINQEGCLERAPVNVGVDGDWGFNQPLLQCFGDHANFVPNSNAITDAIFRPENVLMVSNSNATTAPDKSTGVTEICSNVDVEEVEHNIIWPDFEAIVGQTKTISLFVKPGACKYFAFRFVDMVVTNLEVQAIYNLVECTVDVPNPLGRYSAEIHRLANGWVRCCFTIYHHIGQRANLTGTFFNAKLSNITESYYFKAEGEVLGYVWGVQLENNVAASGYIPTLETPITERGFYYAVDIANTIDINNMTLLLQFRNPRTWGRVDLVRPLFTIVDADWKPIWSCRMMNNGEIITEMISLVAADGGIEVPLIEFYDRISSSTATWGQLAISIGSNGVHTQYNQNPGFSLEFTPTTRKGYKLLIGCDERANTLSGYIRSITLYSKSSSSKELEFLVGEIIHD